MGSLFMYIREDRSICFCYDLYSVYKMTLFFGAQKTKRSFR